MASVFSQIPDRNPIRASRSLEHFRAVLVSHVGGPAKRPGKEIAMYCSSCGVQLEDRFSYCHHCGRPTHPDRTSPWGVPKRLTRPLWEKKIGGVCAGFARYFEVDVSLMRIIWLVTSLVTGVGFIAYLVAWVAMPAEESLAMPPYANGPGSASAPPPPRNDPSASGTGAGSAQTPAQVEL